MLATANAPARPALTVVPKTWDFLESTRARINILYGGAGSSKCLAKGTQVIMHNGRLKAVEDIAPGDLLMGPDGKPRTVLDVSVGYGPLYRVKQNRGMDYVVNANHILSLRKDEDSQKPKGLLPSGNYRWPRGQYGTTPELINIPVSDYMGKSAKWKQSFKGWRPQGGIEIPERNVPIDPYVLGIWLGDGTSCRFEITTADQEVEDALREFTDSVDLALTVHRQVGEAVRSLWVANKGRIPGKKNKALDWLRQYNLINNKHIPDDYLYNSRDCRLRLLAGLIDSDGCVSNNNCGITQKSHRLAKQIQYLCHSLGMGASFRERQVKLPGKDVVRTYYHIRISGRLCDVPTRIARKQVVGFKLNKAEWRWGIHIKPECEGDYYGFAVDGDHLFMLQDFTVTHNSWQVARHLLFNKFLKEKGIRILVVRKTLPSLRTSCYDLIIALLRKYKIPFEWNKSNLVISNGRNQILFRSLDDVEKLKSIEDINYVWVEEATEISRKDYMQLNLRCRAMTPGVLNQTFFTFNPVDENSFFKPITEYTAEERAEKDVAVNFSTYLDNPYLPEVEVRVIERLRAEDATYWKIYGEGKWATPSNIVYTNWDIVPDSMWPALFDDERYGVDFGFSESECAALHVRRVGWDLYVRQLVYEKKLTVNDLKVKLRREISPEDYTRMMCDSARPDDIEELHRAGFNAHGAKKGPGSVKTGIQRVKQFRVHILESSVDLQREKRGYKWKEDKNDNVLDAVVQWHDHGMDAERYAVSDMAKTGPDYSGYGTAEQMQAHKSAKMAQDSTGAKSLIDSLARSNVTAICQNIVRNPTPAIMAALKDGENHADQMVAWRCREMLRVLRTRVKMPPRIPGV